MSTKLTNPDAGTVIHASGDLVQKLVDVGWKKESRRKKAADSESGSGENE